MSINLPTTGVTSAAAAEMLTGNQVTPTTGGGLPFLRFDAKRTGDWIIGADAEVCTDDEIVIDVTSLEHGWILWHNKKASRQLVKINQPLPEPQEPVHYTDAKGKPAVDEASEARAFKAAFLDDGLEFLFETSTFGGRKAFDAMLGVMISRAQAGSPYIFPKVKLDTDSYEHPSWGLTMEPVLTPVAWYDADGNEEGAAPAKLDRPGKKNTKAEGEPALEPEFEPEFEAAEAEPVTEEVAAPGRKRRRRTAA